MPPSAKATQGVAGKVAASAMSSNTRCGGAQLVGSALGVAEAGFVA